MSLHKEVVQNDRSMLMDIRNYWKFSTTPKQKFIEGPLLKSKATIQIAILKKHSNNAIY